MSATLGLPSLRFPTLPKPLLPLTLALALALTLALYFSVFK